MPKKEITYLVVEPVLTGSGTGFRNPGIDPIGIRTSFQIYEPGPTGTGTDSVKIDWVPSLA